MVRLGIAHGKSVRDEWNDSDSKVVVVIPEKFSYISLVHMVHLVHRGTSGNLSWEVGTG